MNLHGLERNGSALDTLATRHVISVTGNFVRFKRRALRNHATPSVKNSAHGADESQIGQRRHPCEGRGPEDIEAPGFLPFTGMTGSAPANRALFLTLVTISG